MLRLSFSISDSCSPAFLCKQLAQYFPTILCREPCRPCTDAGFVVYFEYLKYLNSRGDSMRKIAYFCILGILAASAAGCQSVSETIQNNGAATTAAESSAAYMTVSTSDAAYTASPASVSATTAVATVQASSSAAAAETPAVTAPSSETASQEHATTAAINLL